jgi:serine/threonine protein kinase/TolB-like protein/thioredoxin-like negative regulator of GroEL
MGLSAVQMARMSALLDEALELDEAGRRLWLDRLGPEHRELEGALRQALLPQEGDGAGSDRLATLPKVEAAGGRVSTLKPGERVGPYQLERALGSGGMAEVWLAQRADGAFKREVALKLPMLSGLRQDLASRFARERDILAGLEHPNIARLYDAGVTPEGLPYLAMEYVHGEPLTAWCDAHRLGVRERLKLFLQVLEAVQYAHGHHVIHRDIKPSNILVSDSGQVRLLDFGVAKLLAYEDAQTELTQIYGRALTPDYASPELVRGDPIDAAADVYSLGVVLYELLAGSRPYRLKATASPALLEQAIATVRIERPSTQLAPEAGPARGTTQHKLVRRLRGDLDAIVLKALAVDPRQRYASASALADDLQRHLAGEPVEARPDSVPYRTGRFVLRHRAGAVTAAAATVAMAAVGLVLIRAPTAVAPVPAPSAPTEVSAPDKSIAVLPFVDMSEKKDQEYLSDGLSEEVLGLLSRVPGLHVAARTSAFSFKGKSDDIPTIARKLRVANVLEGSVRKSGNRLRITAQLVRADNGYHLWSQTYERKLDDVFKVQDEIAGAVVGALKVSLLSDAMPKATGTSNIDAYKLYLQARAISFRAAGPADWEKVVDYLLTTVGLDPTFAPAWALLSRARSAYAAYAPDPESWEEARRAASQALSLDPKLAAAHTAMAKIHFLHDWDWPGAQAQARQALGLDPGDAQALRWSGAVSVTMGQLDQALELLQRGVASDPLDPHAYSLLGEVHYRVGHLTEAQSALRKTLDLNSREYGAHLGVGLVMLARGDSAAALSEIDQESDEENRHLGRALAYFALGRKADADSVVADMEKKYAEKSAYDIARVHASRGEVDQAFAWLDRAYNQREPSCVWIKSDPFLKNLQRDPRYKAFLHKMKLPE